MGSNHYRITREEQGLCITCGTELPEGYDKKVCSACREKKRESNQQRKAMREAQGLCVTCGRKLEEGYQSKSCPECLQKRSQQRKKLKAIETATASSFKVEDLSIEADNRIEELKASTDSTEQAIQETTEAEAKGAMPDSKASHSSSGSLDSLNQRMTEQEREAEKDIAMKNKKQCFIGERLASGLWINVATGETDTDWQSLMDKSLRP